MAHNASKGRALWNEGNVQQQDLVSDHPKYADILNNKRPVLTKIVQPLHLWTYLRRYGVLDKDIQEDLTRPTRQQTVEQLLDHLECGPSWRLHAFLRACCLTHQQHVVTEAGFNPEDYEGPSPTVSDEDEPSPPPVCDRHQGASGTSSTTDAAVSISRELNDSTAKAMKKELKSEGHRLLEPSGLGALADNVMFIGYLRSLEILIDSDIQIIEAKQTPSQKTAALLAYLLPCASGRLIGFAWILMKMNQCHQFMSIPKDVKQSLKGMNKDRLQELFKD